MQIRLLKSDRGPLFAALHLRDALGKVCYCTDLQNGDITIQNGDGHDLDTVRGLGYVVELVGTYNAKPDGNIAVGHTQAGVL
jgi:hypothetical protein